MYSFSGCNLTPERTISYPIQSPSQGQHPPRSYVELVTYPSQTSNRSPANDCTSISIRPRQAITQSHPHPHAFPNVPHPHIAFAPRPAIKPTSKNLTQSSVNHLATRPSKLRSAIPQLLPTHAGGLRSSPFLVAETSPSLML